MVDRLPTDPGEALDRPVESSPQRLLHEAISLAVILGASLTLSAVEYRGLTAWQGYPSSLLLLGLAWWHKRRFDVSVDLSRPRAGGRILLVALSLGLVSLLLISAGAPLWPQTGHGSAPLQSVHLLLLVPLSEEFYFRGVLFDHLRRGFSAAGAVVLCSMLFAVLHLPTGGAIGAGLLSLAACLLVLAGGWGYAFQLHVAYNGLSQINRIGDPSSRWTSTAFASIVVLTVALAMWKKPKERSPGD